MENKTIVRNTAVLSAIIAAAPMRKAINAKATEMDSASMTAWKAYVSALVSAVSDYVSAMQADSNAAIMGEKILQDNAAAAKKTAVSGIYSALADIRSFAGFTFPNGENEPELLAIRLTATKAEKDENGNAVDVFDCIKGEQTARREVERYLYDRQMGKVGKTAEQYAAEKAAAKAARKEAQKAAQKAKQEAAAKKKEAENSATSEAAAIVDTENAKAEKAA